VAEVQLFRPRGAISTARPRFIGHSGENVLFGRPLSGNSCLLESRVKCTILPILAQSHKIKMRMDCAHNNALTLLRRSGFAWIAARIQNPSKPKRQARANRCLRAAVAENRTNSRDPEASSAASAHRRRATDKMQARSLTPFAKRARAK
jgi:hypothetical protein